MRVSVATVVRGILSAGVAMTCLHCANFEGHGSRPEDAGTPRDDQLSDALAFPHAGACGETACLSADELRDCTDGEQVVTCALGCDETGGPHCRRLVPSNGVDDRYLTYVTQGLSVLAGDTAVLDTDDGSITGISDGRPAGVGTLSGIHFVKFGNGISLFGVTYADIDGDVQVTGNNALVILSLNGISINGTIDVSANQSSGGPGGGDGAQRLLYAATGCAPGGNGAPGSKSGNRAGGGGGFGADGAAGGAFDDAIPGLGGDASGCSAALAPLTGGSGGGCGSTYCTAGGGGGAVQLSSYTSIELTGTIAASGAGVEEYGGGGGSGGAILLEAPAITIVNAVIAANGGGGAGGRSADRGEGGQASDLQAEGHIDGGGDGGALSGLAQPGFDSINGAGGGGGGVGVIRLHAPPGALTSEGSVFSPAPIEAEPMAE